MNKKKNIVELTHTTIEDYRQCAKRQFMVVADSVRSLHNIGSMFRTADAFRLHSILLCGISGRPPHPELHKTALGAEESVAWSYEAHIDAAVAHLKGEGWHIAVLEQAHGSISLYDFKRQSEDEKIALVVGNEVEGVKQSVVDAADYILEIPQEGTKHSLNVSVSAGMAIYEICRRW
jgi:tRNA G18 (ribose-2'-O)-methylase SpoU